MAELSSDEIGRALGMSSSGARGRLSTGQIDRLWILDVGGARLVIDAQFMPEATEQQVVELLQVVESIRFER